jgi:hypothetical protein
MELRRMQPASVLSEPAELAKALGPELQTQWGLLLWRVRLKGDWLKLTMQACRPVDEPALRAWLLHRLGSGREIVLVFKPMSACCGSGCTGCLIGNPAMKS